MIAEVSENNKHASTNTCGCCSSVVHITLFWLIFCSSSTWRTVFCHFLSINACGPPPTKHGTAPGLSVHPSLMEGPRAPTRGSLSTPNIQGTGALINLDRFVYNVHIRSAVPKNHLHAVAFRSAKPPDFLARVIGDQNSIYGQCRCDQN